MIEVRDADRLLRQHVPTLGSVRVPLANAAGRVLRESVAADRDAPPFDRVTMDGIAVAAVSVQGGGARFRVAGTQAAGEPPHTLPGAGECIEIMTGAALPAGCDAVVRYEDVDLRDGWATLHPGVEVRPGQNVHAQGSDRGAGQPVLEAGVRLGPPQVAALAVMGRAEVRVSAAPRVAVLSTGDELVAVGAPVRPHQIREANGPTAESALRLRGYGGVTVECVADDAGRLRRAVERALADADVLVLSGGVSAGRFDLVPGVLAELGVRTVFHRVRQRPGKPLWFGVAAGGQAVFGLPGNPVSALVGLVRYVLPSLARAEGAAEAPPAACRLAALPHRANSFTLFVPVRREGLDAHPVPTNGSGDALSLLASDGFAEAAADVTVGDTVPFYPWAPP